MSKTAINAVAVYPLLLSFLWVLKTLNALGVFGGGTPLEQAYTEHYYTWIQSGMLNIGVDFAIDRLTVVMLMIVTGVGFLIHVYAIGYMAHEGGYYCFFAYLNLFMFFMLVLVLAANFLLLFVGWEGVGLCSYLLVGFYFTEKFATDAGNKAFIVNRVGDFGFSLAVFLIVMHFGSLDFATVFGKVQGMPVESSAGWMTAIALLLFVGATGKSAQIPLYVWLPDAMAGPTPVSALIHAATMVTAGVYMVTRSSSIFLHAHGALEVVAIIGLATAFFAATMGLAQTDIKKVYAYSTVSQLGYMFLGLGTGAFSAGIFHVMTHAFFKALLFLGAGSVIHAMSGEQDLRKMGGLRKYTPITFWTLLCASVAIAGVPPFSGYHSKDAILASAYDYAPWMYWVGVFTAGDIVSAWRVPRVLPGVLWRARWKIEAHDAHGHDAHGHGAAHESPPSMWIPLAVLAVLSLVGGYINIPKWLEPMFKVPEEAPGVPWTALVSVAAGLIGIALAAWFYLISPAIPEGLALGLQHALPLDLQQVLRRRVPGDSVVVEPMIDGSVRFWRRVVDVGGIDGIVNGATRPRATSAASQSGCSPVR